MVTIRREHRGQRVADAYESELPRTFLHLIWGTALALAYRSFLPRIWTLAIIAAFIALMVVLEWLRNRYLKRGRPRRPRTPAPGDLDRHLGLFAGIYGRVAAPFLRGREWRGDWAAALASLVGYFAVVLLFTRGAAVGAILVASLGDPVARLVGRRFGTLHVVGRDTKKSLEGLLALGLVGFLVLRVTGFGAWPALAGSAAAIAADLLSTFKLGALRIEDNLVMPALVGAVLFLVSKTSI